MMWLLGGPGRRRASSGATGADVLFAGSGDNVALGGTGDDVLRGEEGDATRSQLAAPTTTF